jgi:hypothetical protein
MYFGDCKMTEIPEASLRSKMCGVVQLEQRYTKHCEVVATTRWLNAIEIFTTRSRNSAMVRM